LDRKAGGGEKHGCKFGHRRGSGKGAQLPPLSRYRITYSARGGGRGLHNPSRNTSGYKVRRDDPHGTLGDAACCTPVRSRSSRFPYSYLQCGIVLLTLGLNFNPLHHRTNHMHDMTFPGCNVKLFFFSSKAALKPLFIWCSVPAYATRWCTSSSPTPRLASGF